MSHLSAHGMRCSETLAFEQLHAHLHEPDNFQAVPSH